MDDTFSHIENQDDIETLKEENQNMKKILTNIFELICSEPPEEEDGLLTPSPQMYSDFGTTLAGAIGIEMT